MKGSGPCPAQLAVWGGVAGQAQHRAPQYTDTGLFTRKRGGCERPGDGYRKSSREKIKELERLYGREEGV